MEVSGSGKTPNTSLSFRYNANNEELEQLFSSQQSCDDDPPTPQAEPPVRSESASPKKTEKSSSIIDKYFKSMRTEKPVEKVEDVKNETKADEKKGDPPKEVTASPMKEYLNRLGKRNTSEVVADVKDKEANETWKIFHDFKFKIAQAVEDMKTRSVEEKDKLLPRENSTDSEDNSALKDSDQQSIGDTDNQVSSLDSSLQNLSDVTQPLTAKPTDVDASKDLSLNKSNTDSSDDTHKNLARSESDLGGEFLQDSLEVESGVEALEDTIDAFGDVTQVDTDILNRTLDTDVSRPPSAPTNFGLPPSKNNLLKDETTIKPKKAYLFKYSMYILTIFLIINYLLFPNCNIWNGFWLGIWFFCVVTNMKDWVLDNYFSEWEPRKTGYFQLKRTSAVPFAYTIPSVKEHRPLKKYEGWINHYRYPDYDPYTYHINKTTTAFMKLEGCNLRISYTSAKIAKRALWDEKIEKITFYQHRLYNLTGARVIMLPYGLVRRSIPHNETDTGIEGLRHRIVRKMHRDKKADSTTAVSDPEVQGQSDKTTLLEEVETEVEITPKPTLSTKEDEEELDESELTRIKEFLEDTEYDPNNEGSAEGEWSIHVKNSKDKHSRLYLFARTGRDKHEWYRRLVIAVSEANASQDNSSSEDKSGSDTVQETKDGVEMSVYKITEKDTVAFAKNKTNDSITEGVTITSPVHPVPTSVDSYEKSFWPYLQKIIQPQNPSPDCECRMLPAEATWVNTVLARLIVATPEGGSSKKKFLRMVDKIATNKYFQQVTDYKYVKRAMEGLSNTDIKLQLEVNGLEGRLAINLPPPPHDRLWIGFSTNPQLVLKARPAVGARALRFAHISNWIEQKLTKEFEKVLVLPNMEDIIIDVLTPTPVDFE
ncbi:jg16000 [Pararge aegeria aegeria]|uniref:Jg16000 protein n=1 Tax=Pararge aegeria aegeria TaxID=348720 RepID=A0A8S4SPV2_9NEOP|nr:jg16000 [Pararge aegeria aegeria]